MVESGEYGSGVGHSDSQSAKGDSGEYKLIVESGEYGRSSGRGSRSTEENRARLWQRAGERERDLFAIVEEKMVD